MDTDETAAELLYERIATMYMDGEKITTIEKDLGVSRSSIYYALKKLGVAPERAKPAVRLRGDDHDLQTWVMLAESLQERVRQLEDFVSEAGLTVPKEI